MALDKEILESDDFKAAVKAAAEEAAAGLKAKNDELLAEKKAEQLKVKEAEATAKDMAERIDALETAAADATGDADTIRKKAEDNAAKAIAKAEAERDAAQAIANQAVIDTGLESALTAANIAPQYRKAVAAMYRTDNEITIGEVDGRPAAVIDGKPMAETFAEWSQGDDGKTFVAAADNSGTGASGANGKGQGPDPSKKPSNTWTPAEKSAYIRENSLEKWNALVAEQSAKTRADAQA